MPALMGMRLLRSHAGPPLLAPVPKLVPLDCEDCALLPLCVELPCAELAPEVRDEVPAPLPLATEAALPLLAWLLAAAVEVEPPPPEEDDELEDDDDEEVQPWRATEANTVVPRQVITRFMVGLLF